MVVCNKGADSGSTVRAMISLTELYYLSGIFDSIHCVLRTIVICAAPVKMELTKA